jgi:ubiquinone/menaquinone biosynthesis C-methylase UbiE
LGRPIIIDPWMRIQWIPPINDALGIMVSESFDASLKRAAKVGIRNIKAQPDRPPKRITRRDIESFQTHDIIAAAKYRRSGRWFEHRRRSDYHKWSAIPTRSTPALYEFYRQVVRARPKKILDLASGGGGGINTIVRNLPGLECCFATERDVKCLWSLQYRFGFLNPRNWTEAIGCDVRQLPFQDDAFDTVTCYMSFSEIAGYSRALSEAYRVLEPNGKAIIISYQTFFKTHHFDQDFIAKIPSRDLLLLARKTDIYYDAEGLMQQARETGFNVQHARSVLDHDKRYIITTLMK